MQLYKSKEIVNKLTEQLKKEFQLISAELNRAPRLAIIQIGDNEASNKYIKHKIMKANELGVEVKLHKFTEDIENKALLKEIDEINEYSDGIIVQLPIPEHLHTKVILDSVRLEKDVDGLSSKNEFNFYNDKDMEKYFHFIPATALAVQEIVNHYKIDLKDKKVAVVGRSNLVGKPIAHILKRIGGKSINIATYNKKSTIKGIENADIVVAGAGVPGLIKKENLKKGAIVIDVGTTYVCLENGKEKLVGDVDLTDLEDHIVGITPVPGGVGPLTVMSIFINLAIAIQHQQDSAYKAKQRE
ncbi:bifunctional 5,10-methylenetetrahydrofolate dehydrogenase/5,10-methenyltetrahydrofolate cyclohydrolase [Mycoplasmopsis iners]|uniref:bifunctional 5,10-methylenetetrahydrofolate dehydrogenase/5,10-methenyltetrahydrofolate cyclohydrolase n=1 Tax=Mycoplasmopsis iners TaxID=76630 RepID=UPI000496F3B0|nr:bifunctional 5,10-methylenetetrahydrofolate dehydrogenase/5,10-methenyltetrahydrofolate cyclohydrolase [Mycoplasmopsis iners]